MLGYNQLHPSNIVYQTDQSAPMLSRTQYFFQIPSYSKYYTTIDTHQYRDPLPKTVAKTVGSRPLYGSPLPQESSITDAAARMRPPRRHGRRCRMQASFISTPTRSHAGVLHLHGRRCCTQAPSTFTAAPAATRGPPPPRRRCRTQDSSTTAAVGTAGYSRTLIHPAATI
jgi:hypothetical protein